MLKEIGLPGNWAKIGLTVGIIVVVVVVVGFFVKSIIGTEPKETTAAKPLPAVSLLCTNPDCGKNFSVSAKEYDDMMRAEVQSWSNGRPPVDGRIFFTCKFCGKKSASVVKKSTANKD